MQLVATELLATYRAVEPFRLPFHSGSMLRGVLGRALRAVGCGNIDAVCSGECERPRACTYARLFDPPVPDPVPHRFLKGQTRAPQPLIPIFPPAGQKELRAGETFSFAIRLLGPLRDGELETLFVALERVRDFDLGQDGGKLAFVQATMQGRREAPIDVGGESEVERIEVVFETPAWLEQAGRLMERMTFQSFFRTIYRRLTVLCALYGEGAEIADADFPRLDAWAQKVEVLRHEVTVLEEWNRRSLAREREHRMQGVLGRVVFVGNELGAFVPMLRLAEKTHVGKATSFGLGRIRLTVGR